MTQLLVPNNGLIGAKPKVDVKSSLTFKPTQEEKDAFFEKFIKDESYFDNYKHYSLRRPGSLIVRLACLIKETSVILDGDNKFLYAILPWCKVIKAHPKGMMNDESRFKAGDVIHVNETIGLIETNPNWIAWNKMIQKERGALTELDEPARLVGLIMKWQADSQISLREDSFDNDWTFIKSEGDFSGIVYEG